jgi:glycosyltransferase involved in cell wall biosynthesis
MMASSHGVGLTYHLTRLSIALKKKGHNVSVVSGPNEQVEGLFTELEKTGIEHFVSEHIDRMDFVSINKFRKDVLQVLKAKDFDIIHANGAVHALPSYLATKSISVNRKPAIVASVHSVPDESIWQKPKWTVMTVILNKCSNMILPVSNYTREKLITHGVNPQKTVTIHNFIDLEIFDEASKNAKTDIISDNNKNPKVVYVANLVPIKGHEYYLMAAKKVLKKCKANFYVIGDGPRKGYLKKLAYKLGIQDDVIFTGRVHWPQIYYVLSNIVDICVSASLSENFPFYLLECMAAKKPIVATSVGGVPEMIVDGITGYLVPPKDPASMANSILKLINDPDNAREMGLRGRQIVEKEFNMTVAISKLENIYVRTKLLM